MVHFVSSTENIRSASMVYRFFSTLFFVLLLLCLNSCGNQKEKHLLVGDLAPAFEITDLSGRIVSTELSKGAPIILRFFDPYCKYCKADTVVFNQYYEKYKGRGLQVVYIDTDSDVVKINEFIKDLKIKFPVVMDSDQKMAHLFMVRIIPQTIVLDPTHKIVGALLGGVAPAELDDLLGSYLSE